MTRKILVAVAIVAAVVAAGVLLERGLRPDHAPQPAPGAEAEAQAEVYTCPMHPSVVSDRPGACPVCGMALVRKSAAAGMDSAATEDLRTVSLSPTQRVTANVSAVPATRRPMARTVRMIGSIAYDERRFAIVTARFPGRIEKLLVLCCGPVVRKGETMVELYSPEAVAAQQEYLVAVAGSPDSGTGSGGGAPGFAENARQRLLLWGFTDEDLEHLRANRAPQFMVPVRAPISGTVLKKNADLQRYVTTGENLYEIADLSEVWAMLEVYENDLRHLAVGQEVLLTTQAYPGESYRGRVTLVEPVVDPRTRTVRVRAEVPNPLRRLKPNMYVSAELRTVRRDVLTVPAGAVLSTGRNSVVWVEEHENTFAPRTVVTGLEDGGVVEILSGLREGEQVAATGGFLLDSESALQAPSGLGHTSHAGSSAGSEAAAVPRDGELDIVVKGGYSPSVILLKQGETVRLNFRREEESACTEELVIDAFDVRKKLPAWRTTTVVLTPRQPGVFGFSCGMKMLHGKIVVE